MQRYRLATLFYSPASYSEIIEIFAKNSENTRRDGIPALEDELPEPELPEPLRSVYRTTIRLLLDGNEPEILEKILDEHYRTYVSRLRYRWKVWKNLLIYLAERRPVAQEAKSFPEAVLLEGHQDNRHVLAALAEFLGLYFQVEANPGAGIGDKLPPHPLLRSNLKLMSKFKSLESTHFRQILEEQYQSYENEFTNYFQMIAEGMQAVQAGDSPRVVRDILGAIAGAGHNADQVEEPTYEEMWREYLTLVDHKPGGDISHAELLRRLSVLKNESWLKSWRERKKKGQS